MTFPFWLRNLTHSLATTLKKSRPSAARPRRGNSRLNVEPLEHRCLLSAGALDTDFGSGGVVTTVLAGTQQGSDVAVYPTGTANAGKIVVGGGQSGGDPQFLLLRYNANGTLDTSFDQDGVVTTNFERNNRYEAITAVAIQPDGKIVAAGTASTNIAGVSSVNSNWRLARYNTNGTLDKTFDTDGKVALFPSSGRASIRDLLIQPDGKIVVIGSGNDQPVIVRFLANGKLDTSFDGDGIATVASSIGFNAVALQSGKLVVAGSAVSWIRPDDDLTKNINEYRVFETSAFWRFDLLNGSLDGSFGTNGRFVLNLNDADRDGRVESDDRAKAVVIQPADGKILALIEPGVVTVVRIGSAGVLDTSYGTSGIARTSGAYIAPGKFFVSTYESPGNTALVLQADGKPVVAVQSQYADLNQDGTYSHTPFAAVLRYSWDGVLDNTWASTTQVTGTASGTGPVNGTLHDSFTFTAPTGAVTGGATVTATFTSDYPITVTGDVTGQVVGTFTGTALLSKSTGSEETWYINAGRGTATGTVPGTVTGTVTGADTVTGVVTVNGTGTAATVTNTATGTVIGTVTSAFTGRFTSLFTVTGPVTGAVTGGIVHNLAVHAGNHVALQPDGKVVIMGYTVDGTDVVMARYLDDSALQAAGGAPRHQTAAGTLTSKQIQPILAEAIARWQAAGVDASALGNIQLQVADLDGATLGMASGHTLWLDDNAAGWGWFVDPTPRNDSEFFRPGNQGEQNRMDLLTVVMHELGHLLEQHHDAGGVMTEALAAGVRQTDLQRDHFALTDEVFDHSGDHRVDMWMDDPLAENRESIRPGSKRLGSKRRR